MSGRPGRLLESSRRAYTLANTAIYFDKALSAKHQTGPGHPESLARLDAIEKALNAFPDLPRLKGRLATRDELELAHDPAYLDLAEKEIAQKRSQLSTGDTAISPASWQVALGATGGVLAAVDQIAAGHTGQAFCAVRPPGHHATVNRGMGFCIVNHIAVAARYARRKHGIERALIVDWDVHHGNGTQDIFYSDGNVLFLSTHQHPWYPGTGSDAEKGEGKGEGLIHNFPLPAGTDGQTVQAIFTGHLRKAADEFKPQMVFLSAGFDSRAGDPLGQFRLTDEDFYRLTEVLIEIAARHCQGRLLSLLEGGYSLTGLERAISSHLRSLTAAPSRSQQPSPPNQD